MCAGQSASDIWFISLLTLFSACNHLSHTYTLIKLREAVQVGEQANAKLRKANTKLKKARAAKSEFLANMSHGILPLI